MIFVHGKDSFNFYVLQFVKLSLLKSIINFKLIVELLHL